MNFGTYILSQKLADSSQVTLTNISYQEDGIPIEELDTKIVIRVRGYILR